MSVAKVPRETLAVALGADELATALAQAGHEVVRTGSYGLCWAEPMIDIGRYCLRAGHGPRRS